MKSVTLKQFQSSLDNVINSVVGNGDIVHVEIDKEHAFVILEEAEYKMMRDALATLLTSTNRPAHIGHIAVSKKLLEKLANEPLATEQKG